MAEEKKKAKPVEEKAKPVEKKGDGKRKKERPESPERMEPSEGGIEAPFLSPEGIVMLFAAGLLDLIGIALLFFGGDDLWITDTIGLIFIGTWMVLRFGSTAAFGMKKKRERNKKIAKKMGRKLGKRLGLTFLIEIIPWVGGLIPAWTIAVYYELKHN